MCSNSLSARFWNSVWDIPRILLFFCSLMFLSALFRHVSVSISCVFSFLIFNKPYFVAFFILLIILNCNIIETHRFLCHIMTIVAYFWLKLKSYPEKVTLLADYIFMWILNFINIYAFWDINSIILQHLYLTQLIRTNIHLRKHVDSISSLHWKPIEQLFYVTIYVNHYLNWIWFLHIFHQNHLGYYLLV